MAQGKIKIVIDLEPGGAREARIIASTPEARDLAHQRLGKCMPILELLEQAIQQAEDEEKQF